MIIPMPGMLAPDFNTMSARSDGINTTLSLSELINGSWCLLFFYPMDFGYICPSELLELNEIKPELDKLNCNIVGCSTDSAVTHNIFLSRSPEKAGVKGIQFPLLEDVNEVITGPYGVLRKDSGYCFRGYFLIDSDGFIRARFVSDLPIGLGIADLPNKIRAIQAAMKQATWFSKNFYEESIIYNDAEYSIADWVPPATEDGVEVDDVSAESAPETEEEIEEVEEGSTDGASAESKPPSDKEKEIEVEKASAESTAKSKPASGNEATKDDKVVKYDPEKRTYSKASTPAAKTEAEMKNDKKSSEGAPKKTGDDKKSEEASQEAVKDKKSSEGEPERTSEEGKSSEDSNKKTEGGAAQTEEKEKNVDKTKNDMKSSEKADGETKVDEKSPDYGAAKDDKSSVKPEADAKDKNNNEVPSAEGKDETAAEQAKQSSSADSAKPETKTPSPLETQKADEKAADEARNPPAQSPEPSSKKGSNESSGLQLVTAMVHKVQPKFNSSCIHDISLQNICQACEDNFNFF